MAESEQALSKNDMNSASERGELGSAERARVSLAKVLRVRAWVVLTLCMAAMIGLVSLVRVEPFATSGDGYVYNLALIKLQVDEVLAGELPRMFWQLGSGWTPLESGQTGLVYFPLLVCDLIAAWLGRPLALLDVSGWLHLWLAGAVALLALPRDIHGSERTAWAVLVAVQPAPFLIGLNWHDYVMPYPWFVASLLLLRRELEAGESSRARRCLVLASSALFFSAAHPHMYLLGVLFVAAWILLEGRRRSLPVLSTWAFAQVPFLVPMFFLRGVAAAAADHWLAGRSRDTFILTEAQHIDTALYGVLFGNLAGAADFRLWPGVSATGIGLFFSPALAFVLGDSLRRKHFQRFGFWTLCLVLVGLSSFPLLRHLIPAALGFRWTWKLMLFVGPAAVLAAANVFEKSGLRSGYRPAVVWTAAGFSALVCLNGLDFNLTPTFQDVNRLGATGLVAETRRALGQAGVPPGSRLALVTDQAIGDTGLPLAVLGIMGNAAPLAGYETAHLYEPLENREAARSHFNLSIVWRGAVSPAWYRKNPELAERTLARIGVDALVSPNLDVFDKLGGRRIVDSLGRASVVRIFEQPSLDFPWATAAGRRILLDRFPGGRLVTREPLLTAPRLSVPREVRWLRLSDGRWQATPAWLSTGWIVAGLAFGLAGIALIVAPRWRGSRRESLAS